MCVVPLMVAILRSAEHIRNFVTSSVWKCVNFSDKDTYNNVLFHCHLRPDTLYCVDVKKIIPRLRDTVIVNSDKVEASFNKNFSVGFNSQNFSLTGRVLLRANFQTTSKYGSSVLDFKNLEVNIRLNLQAFLQNYRIAHWRTPQILPNKLTP
jgi:hypothetical protein